MKASVAIVGLACRYPDAPSPDALWENVLARRRAFRRIPAERLRLADYFSADRAAADATYSAQAAVLEDFEFDREKFRVSGTTFRAVDMTHWLALDTASRALADAGFVDGVGLPDATTGVLVGNSLAGEFSRANLMRLRWPYVRRVVGDVLARHDVLSADRAAFWEELEELYKDPFPAVGDESLAGGLANTIAGRICNHFGLHGGGYTVDGACASSLLAVANACSALLAEDLDVAIAGGVDLSLDPFELIGFAKLGALAPDQMRVYDARSAGFLPGEGCGMVVLMRTADAVAQGRPIYAQIRGWGISSDGRGGITRPEYAGQQLALARAYRKAGFDAASVSYFEGHGTGTPVGDATELKVVVAARRAADPSAPPAAIGSIKANIGHTKAAAGVAGLIKATLAIQAQLLPPTTGWETPHPELSAGDLPPALELLGEGRAWPANRPLRAAVSAMGFGGINAHIVLEGVARHRRRAIDTASHRLLSSAQDAELFVLSAADAPSLAALVDTLAAQADGLSQAELADLAAELARRAEHGPARAALVASTPGELTAGLATLAAWIAEGTVAQIDTRAGVALGSGTGRPRIGFLFPGQGSPTHVGGGAWRRRFDDINELYAATGIHFQQDSFATEVAQPAICTASLAGLQLLEQLGVDASVVIGHSLGELTAYCWAGAFDELALVRIAKARGEAIAQFGKPGGGMASIAAGAARVRTLLQGEAVVISGLNSPNQTIVAGEQTAIEAVVKNARSHGLSAVALAVSHAFHSPMVADAAAALRHFLATEQIASCAHSVASTITGQLLQPEENLRELLTLQMNSPVRLMEALHTARDRVDLWIEVGPGTVLTGIVGSQVEAPVMPLDAGGESLRPLLSTIAIAFAMGVPVRHRVLFDGRFTRPFDLARPHNFLANPCEQAPTGDHADQQVVRVPRVAKPQHIESARAVEAIGVDGGESIRDVVKRLVAARAELPVDIITDDSRLLGDLHLSSLAVGHLVAEVSKALGLPPPASPTDYAHATVAQVAQALEQLSATGPAQPAAAQPEVIQGVDHWVRPFTVQWVERMLPKSIDVPASGAWSIIAPPEHALAERLREQSAGLPGAGVILCLPPNPHEQHAPMFLSAARAMPQAGENRYFVVVQQGGGGGGGFARTLHLEYPGVVTCVIDLPADHVDAATWIVQEVRAACGHVESRYDRSGRRSEPVWRLASGDDQLSTLPLGPGDVLLVSGGGKGIAAECALEVAKKTGVRLALIGRSNPESDAQLAVNLRRMTSAGIETRYYAADVVDPEAVGRAVAAIQAELGPITAILHGAGANTPRLISSLDEQAFQATLRPKLAGLRNLLSAVDSSALRLLVSFGSIIARAGLPGEADYAVANEWLASLCDDWGRRHPHCRCLTVEWSVWSGVGMGERLGRIDTLLERGISPITPDQGASALVELLLRPGLPSTVIVAGRFGDPPTVQFDKPQLPLWRFIERPRYYLPGVELIIDADLSADADPHIRDHVFQAAPLFAAVMGLEAMAQVAIALSGASRVVGFEQVVLERPIVVPDGAVATIRVAALMRAPDMIDVVVRAAETDFQVDHFRAVCRVATAQRAASEPPTTGSTCDAACAGPPLRLDPQQDLYGSILFHRGQFCRIAAYRALKAKACVADIASDANAHWFGAFYSDTLLLGDPGARDAAIHAIQACIPHATILPVGVERITFGPGPLAAPCTMSAREQSHRGDLFVYDMEIRAADGQICERWQGLQLRQVRAATPTGPWDESLLAAYVERELAEMVAGTEVSIVIERGSPPGTNGHQAHEGNGERQTRSNAAILRALGHATEISRRPDGKPEAANGVQVSVAHALGRILSVAAASRVSCDLESVAQQPVQQWRDLLGPERFRLAERLAGDNTSEISASATRVWAALECLKKVGAASDAPLTRRASVPDGWAVLSSGRFAIATLLTDIRGCPNPVILAILLEDHAVPVPPQSNGAGHFGRRREELTGP